VSETQLKNAIAIIKKNLGRQVVKNIISEEIKNKTIENISMFTSLKEGTQQCDLVVEAATEDINLKLKIFKEIDDYAPADCILATNTSSISITKIASATRRASQVIGMHFMNPVPVMKLVEIINGIILIKKLLQSSLSFLSNWEKFPVK
jgi:3-hydroxybutyryl-CoA dehydrogenase